MLGCQPLNVPFHFDRDYHTFITTFWVTSHFLNQIFKSCLHFRAALFYWVEKQNQATPWCSHAEGFVISPICLSMYTTAQLTTKFCRAVNMLIISDWLHSVTSTAKTNRMMGQRQVLLLMHGAAAHQIQHFTLCLTLSFWHALFHIVGMLNLKYRCVSLSNFLLLVPQWPREVE